MIDQGSLAVFFGLLLMGATGLILVGEAIYYMAVGIKHVWLKRVGPRVYFAGRALVKGDVRVVRK